MPRHAKGSQEAKDHMAKLRAMRGKNKASKEGEEPASKSSSKRLVKGSQEAKDHMAKLRGMRGKSKSV